MSPIRMEKIESAMRVVLDFHEACNRHDAAAMASLLSADCVLETPSPAPEGSAYTGREAVRRYWEEAFRQSLQVKSSIEEVFGMGMRCIVRWRRDGVDATGSPVRVRGRVHSAGGIDHRNLFVREGIKLTSRRFRSFALLRTGPAGGFAFTSLSRTGVCQPAARRSAGRGHRTSRAPPHPA